MSIAAGVFTPSEFVTMQANAAALFNPSVRKADITPYSDAARILIENQRTSFSLLTDKEKDRDVTVYWTQHCGMSVETLGSQCDTGGTEAGSKSQVYAIDEAKQIDWTVSTDVMRTNVLNVGDVWSQNLAEALKAMDEHLAAYSVAKLESFLGTNPVNTQTMHLIQRYRR
jgi:hypothetical protein